MLSVQTVRAIEAGERPAIRPTTDTAMCAALDWPRGALARILQGHEPPPDDEPSPAHDLETKVAELVQRQLAQAQEQEYRSDAARQLAAWFDTLTDEQRHDLIERLAGLAQANAR